VPTFELRSMRRAELDAIAGLLTASALPMEDLDDAMLGAFVVATDFGDLVGVAGLEAYDSNALFRSLSFDAAHHSSGLRAKVVHAIEAEAHDSGPSHRVSNRICVQSRKRIGAKKQR